MLMSKRTSLTLKALAPLAVLSTLAVASACVSSSSDKDPDDTGTGGTSNVAGSTSTNSGGSMTTGGTTGSSASTSSSGGSPSSGGTAATSTNGETGAVACASPSGDLITDFTYVEDAEAPQPDQVTFGDFAATFSGGTMYYPNGATSTFKSDMTENQWHLSGTISEYAGFGLFFNVCTKVDASAFKGIKLTVSGTLPTGRTLTMSVGTAADTISSTWLNAHKADAATADVAPNFGRCTPASSNQYDGSCGSPKKLITVTSTPTVVEIPWASFTGGKPQNSVNPAELTSINWYLTWNGETDTAYDVDLVIDDLSFVL
jgi:hypothetical protein